MIGHLVSATCHLPFVVFGKFYSETKAPEGWRTPKRWREARPFVIHHSFVIRHLSFVILSLYTCNAESLKIGLLAPPQEPEVISLEQGARLAIEEANQLPGPKSELVIRGRPGQWGTDGDEAAALALDESVGAMIAPPDGAASHQAMQVAGRTRIPVVSLCPDASITASGIPWVLRIVPRTDSEAQTIFAGAPRKSAWAALVPDGRAGREATRDLRTAARNSNCALQEPVNLPRQKPDWEPALKKLLAGNPQNILLWVDPPSAGQLAQRLRQLGYKGLLAGPSRLNCASFLNQVGLAAEGFLVPGLIGSRPSPFAENYRQRFGNAPDFTATMAYDAAFVLRQVLRSSADQPPYRAFPLKIEFSGGSAPLIFDKDGNRQLTLQLLVCRKGQFVSQK